MIGHTRPAHAELGNLNCWSSSIVNALTASQHLKTPRGAQAKMLSDFLHRGTINIGGWIAFRIEILSFCRSASWLIFPRKLSQLSFGKVEDFCLLPHCLTEVLASPLSRGRPAFSSACRVHGVMKANAAGLRFSFANSPAGGDWFNDSTRRFTHQRSPVPPSRQRLRARIGRDRLPL